MATLTKDQKDFLSDFTCRAWRSYVLAQTPGVSRRERREAESIWRRASDTVAAAGGRITFTAHNARAVVDFN